MLYYALVETAIGYVGIIHKGILKSGVMGVLLPRKKEDALKAVKFQYPDAHLHSYASLELLQDMLVDYFEGERIKFPLDVLDMSRCYPFQIEVLKAEWSIPYGNVAFYRTVAEKIGSTAYRAVGNALAHNPFPLIIPCHRAIRSDRTLGGFQGGLKMKRRILELEGVEFDSSGRVKHEFVKENLDSLADYFESPSYLLDFNGTF